MSTRPIPDADVRREVLDPTRSFLVRAPAGSGKTELLVRRLLGLLATVDEPEEVLAITFTRKAAGELRRRVHGVLQRTAAGEEGGDVAAALARAVLARDAARGWGLAQHPARLRIQTIDALNASIASGSPVSAGGNGLRRPVERPAALYLAAAEMTFELVAGNDELATAAATLLRHLDNRLPRATALLATMLARRDQWLPLLGAGSGSTAELRSRLEATLRSLVEHRVAAVAAAVPAALSLEFVALSALAAERRGAGPTTAGDDPLEPELAWWRAAASTWLTRDGQWRRKLDRNGGFPPDDAPAKQRAKDLLARLDGIEALRLALAEAGRLPDPHYGEAQWQVLAALVRLLPAAAAVLRVEFAARGATDFVELAAEALAAVAGEAGPGAAAERFDARVRHLLIDEFQDTSRTQHCLLDALTADFTPGDGRSVFLVGDPMQSIYRFREADVGLFMALAADAPGRLGLEVRTLQANFRSSPAVVEWVNDTFARLLPASDDAESGAVAFAGAMAVRAGTTGDGVWLHAPADASAEAAAVVELVAAARRDHPGGSVGVLVRSRAHAAAILDGLDRAGIDTSVVELRRLGDTTLAHDILALTRALTHAADRLAWLAVLRAPWCGLTLVDLEALAGDASGATVPELLADPGRLARLSSDGQARVARLAAAFARVAIQGGELDLRDRVEGLWTELGGPACAGDELHLADDILGYLEAADAGGDCVDTLALAAALREQAVPGRGGAAVEVLTIHKAKGLEFDTVIVPGLGNPVKTEDRPPLLWRELPGAAAGIVLAPINAAGHDSDALYELLWDLAGRQARAELDRLLYVACTRARHRLHLFGTPRENGPASGSLLQRLAPAVPGGWPSLPAAEPAPAGLAGNATGPDWVRLPLRRLPAGWQRPEPPPALATVQALPAATPPRLAFDWASDLARRTGVVIHRVLQTVAATGSEAWNDEHCGRLARCARTWLAAEGVPDADLEVAARRVDAALATALADPDGRWLLSAGHPESASEYAVTWWDGSRFRRLVMDRTFLAADGTRWIIDYKTGTHAGGDLEGFLVREAERYAEQLRAYRVAWQALGDAPVRVALYFPLLPRLYELR